MSLKDRVLNLAATNERHVGGHDGHELNVRTKRQACNVPNRLSNMGHVHEGLGPARAIGLKGASAKPGCHLRCGVANVNLRAGNREGPTIELELPGEARDGMLGGGVGH